MRNENLEQDDSQNRSASTAQAMPKGESQNAQAQAEKQHSLWPSEQRTANQFTAQLVMKDLDSGVHFYREAFGFKDISNQHPSAEKNPEMRVLECNGLPFLLISEEASRLVEGYHARSPLSLNALSSTVITVLCNDIQKMFEQAVNAGARPIQAPHNIANSGSTFLVAGIENYVWRFIDNFNGLSDAL